MKDPIDVPERTIPERDFSGVDDARRILQGRVMRARKALAQDLETAESCGLEEIGPLRPHAIRVEVSRVFRRTVLFAFYEYVHATTEYVSVEERERAEHSLRDLADRLRIRDLREEAEAERRAGFSPGELEGFRVDVPAAGV